MSSIEVTRDIEFPDDTHTIVSFEIPFSIPVPDGIYAVLFQDSVVEISVKRQQVSRFAGLEVKGKFQLNNDKYGRTSYDFLEMKFPYKLSFQEKRDPPILVKEGAPRVKDKELVINCLNRFIEIVKYCTDEFWVEPIRYQDIISYEVSYWDGKDRYTMITYSLDRGIGEIGVFKTPFKVESRALQSINERLLSNEELEKEKIFRLNAKDAFIQENYKLAIIESVIALEMVLYEFIRLKGEQLDIGKKQIESFIIQVGVYAGIDVVLKILIQDPIEEMQDTISVCKGAITIRNKIMHRGFTDLVANETGEQILTIESMIEFLKSQISNISKKEE